MDWQCGTRALRTSLQVFLRCCSRSPSRAPGSIPSLRSRACSASVLRGHEALEVERIGHLNDPPSTITQDAVMSEPLSIRNLDPGGRVVLVTKRN